MHFGFNICSVSFLTCTALLNPICSIALSNPTTPRDMFPKSKMLWICIPIYL